MTENSKIQIVMYGINECSGSCPFCSLSNTTGMKHSSDDLKVIDDRTYKQVQFNFDKLEQAIVKSPKFSNLRQIIVWGGDPLTSFQAFEEVVDFIHYIEKKYDKQLYITASTNGLAFKRDDVTDFVRKNRLSIQLSHDGTAQYLRTKEDPLTFDNVQSLIHSKNIRSLYCVQTKYNDNIEEQLAIFDKVPVQRIRLSPVRMTNDNFTIPVDSVYFKQLVRILVQLREEGKYNWKALVRQTLTTTKTNCSNYHKGKTDWTDIFDTLGNYTQCHLLDSSQKVAAPDIETNKPERCKHCQFNKSFLCNGCGLVPLKDGRKRLDCFYYKLQLYVREAVKLNPYLLAN